MTDGRHDYVLALALGPVQGFIAAARRSRDLWAGSWILSELAKAAALEWARSGAQVQLVFPALSESELQPNSENNVGNKLRAVARNADEAQVRALLHAAAEAARQRWRGLADDALERLRGASHGLRLAVWEAQRDDWIETYGAWARIEGGADGQGYTAAVQAVERALAARKATRDFAPSAWRPEGAEAGLPKSSLDGARETVLLESAAADLRRRLGLSAGEQLDMAGVIKRVLGRGHDQSFTPLTRIAADDWLQALSPDERQALQQVYEPLVALELATRVRGNGGCYAAFPYDAGLCWRSRMQRALKEAEETAERQQPLRDLQRVLQRLWRQHGEPVPYAAMLQADGDRMGELLDAVPTLEGHQRITRALSDFARTVPDCVRKYRGHAIYAGGDDVLALLPLSGAVACAQELARAFAQRMQTLAESLNLREQPVLPSMSVGVALVHVMEPLGVWREHALQAEKHAKGDGEAPERRRNALCIRLAIRAGHIVQGRWRWDDVCDGRSAVDWLDEWRAALQSGSKRRLPSRLAYDLRELARRGQPIVAERRADADGFKMAWLTSEWRLLLQRARLPNGEKLPDELVAALQKRWRALSTDGASGPAQPIDGELADPDAALRGLARLADELILARWLAARSSADLGREAVA